MTKQELLDGAKEFWDESLVVRAEQRITGANAHDARCWIQKYKACCGIYGHLTGVCAPNAKWYRDVLVIFANGEKKNIGDAQRLHMSRIKAREANHG